MTITVHDYETCLEAQKEKDAEIDEQTKQIHKLTTLLDEQYGTPCEQIRHQAEIDEALDRLWDISLGDDGQAWDEAERFYSKHRDNWGKHKGE